MLQVISKIYKCTILYKHLTKHKTKYKRITVALVRLTKNPKK